MFRITPIGSCRIATPLRLSRDRYGFVLNQDRVYGFTHSSAEAVQLMRYLKGEISIDPQLDPLVSRRGISTANAMPLHESSDFYVVELSSAKVLRIGDTCVQLNCLYGEFGEFFVNRDRSVQFWNLSEACDQAAIDRFLEASWSATPSQRQESELLRQIRRATSNQKDLRQDIRQLIDGLPNVLFVTHIDAVLPNGRTLPSRSRFIKEVETAVRAEGGMIYNPTKSMLDMGQELAIEDYSDSLAHFTDDFAQVVFDDWFELAIRQTMDACATAGGTEAVHRILVPHVQARIAVGESVPLTRRLENLAKALPDCGEIHDLLAGTYAAIGKAQDALRTLRKAASVARSPEICLRWFRLALELVQVDDLSASLDALAEARSRISAQELLAAALLFAREGQSKAALSIALQALDSNPSLTRAADLVLELGGRQVLAGLDARQLERLEQALSTTHRLRFQYLSKRYAALADQVVKAGAVTGDDLADLAESLMADDASDLAMDLIGRWRRIHTPNSLIHPRLRAVVDRVAKTAAARPDRADRIADLQKVLEVNPLHSEARMLLRNLRRDLLTEIRAMSESGDIDGLESLSSDVAVLADPIREYDVLRMRALFSKGELEASISAARRVVAVTPDNLAAWATMMRAAQKTGDLLTLEEAAQRIVEKADDDSRRLSEEARDRLDRNPVLCFRQARVTTEPLLALRLFAIARRDPAFTKAADIRLRRLEAQLTGTVREIEAEDAPQAGLFLGEIVQLFPHNVRMRLAAGRYLFKHRSYAAALPHWEFLRDSCPGNNSYVMQLNRCRDRLSHAETGNG